MAKILPTLHIIRIFRVSAMSEDDLDRPMSPSDLAERVGVSVNIVRRLIREGRLKHVVISRKMRWVTMRDWFAFLEENTRYPGSDERS
ncbi:helix-turn-helix domain-containing protein [Paracoccus sp. S1E-3]|nr:helix-turn-helix domain-containing protein [Paracoccus sp. S1E-3]